MSTDFNARLTEVMKEFTNDPSITLDDLDKLYVAIDHTLDEAPDTTGTVAITGTDPQQIFAGYYQVGLADLRQRIQKLSPHLADRKAEDDFNEQQAALSRLLDQLSKRILSQDKTILPAFDTRFEIIIQCLKTLNEDFDLINAGYCDEQDIQAAANFIIIQHHIESLQDTWRAISDLMMCANHIRQISEKLSLLKQTTIIFIQDEPEILDTPVNISDESIVTVENILKWVQAFVEESYAQVEAGTTYDLKALATEADALQPSVDKVLKAIKPIYSKEAGRRLEKVHILLKDIGKAAKIASQKRGANTGTNEQKAESEGTS